MPQKTSPFLEGKWGWNFGESGWNTGADENWLKFSYMFDANVDAIVATLPVAVNGEAYFLTTDNRIYFVVDGTYYSTPVPKWFQFKIKSTGVVYLFDGASASIYDPSSALAATLASVNGAKNIGFQPEPLYSASNTVSKALSALPVNIWTYSDQVTSKPTPNDPNTWDWTPAVQAAVATNSSIKFPSGTFIFSFINIPNNIKLQGEGVSTVLKQRAATNGPMFRVTAAGISLEISDLVIDGNNSQQTLGLGGFLVNSTFANVLLSFRYVTFKDFSEGALRIVGDRDPLTRERLKVYNCNFRGGVESVSGGYLTYTIFAADACEIEICDNDFDHGLPLTLQGIPAISVAGTVVTSAEYTYVTIRNNSFKGYGRYTVGSGIGVVDCYIWARDVNISDNKFTGSTVVPIRAKVNADRAVIKGNIMSNFSNIAGIPSAVGGISLVSATQAPTKGQYVISGNVVEGALYNGIEVSDSTGNPDSIDISDNIITGSGAIGVSLIRCSNFSVNNNIISSSTQQAVAFSSCINSCEISGNTINGCGVSGIQATGSQLTLDVQVHNNYINLATIAGVSIENVRSLSLQGNVVKDVVLSGSQRGYRVGGTTGTVDGQIKNNLALGTYATAQISVIAPGFTTLYEHGNSWNRKDLYLPAPPSTGTYARGDVTWNTASSAGGYVGWVCVVAGTPGTWQGFGNITLTASTTYDPPSLVDGAGTTTTVTVTGAALGDSVSGVSFSLDIQGVILTAWVSATNTVSVRFQNETGSTVDLASGTLKVSVSKLS